MKAVRVFIFLFLFFSIPWAYSTNIKNELKADIKAYCHYIEAKSAAKNSLLLAPDLIVRAQNANNDYPYQNNLIAALSKDLADFGKLKQIKDLINEECTYYKLNQQARIQIQYALSQIQRQSLAFKLQHIQLAKKKINSLLDSVKKKVDKKNDTLMSLYQIDSSLQKIDAAEREIQVNLAMQQPAKIKTMPLKKLLQKIILAEKRRQATLNKLEKLNNWSIQIQAGAQQNDLAFSHNQATQAYAALFLRYNLGSLFSNHKKNQSLEYYTDWKTKKVNGIQKKLIRLIQSISLLKSSEEARLQHLLANYHKYNGLTKKLNGVNSIKSNKFKQQIAVDQIMMEIEINYLNHLIHLLKEITY